MSNFYPSKEQQEQIKEAAETIQKSCANCNKGEAHTGKDCPTRSGCFTPLYKNWEPIVEADPENPSWEIISFTWDKTDDHLLINLRDKTGTVIMIELSPDEIADFANNH